MISSSGWDFFYFFGQPETRVYSLYDTGTSSGIILVLFRNKLSVLDSIQESSCTLRLRGLLIDFQPGTTSGKHYATGLGPTRGPGAPAVVGGETSN